MDLLAALVFGLVIAENIKGFGVTDPAGLTREISKAGVIAGILMAVIYCGLAFVGTSLGSVMPGATNGAAILTASATLHFGLAGTIIIAAIFLLACLNVCIGLISCCGTYFAETFGAASPNPEQHMLGKLGYPVWAAAFAIFSCFVSNFGLDAILTFSVPLLSALYPVSIALMIMGLAHNACDKLPLVWPWVTGVTTIVSVVIAVRNAFLPDVTLILDALPLANVGLAWLVPAACAAVIGCALSAIKQKKSA